MSGKSYGSFSDHEVMTVQEFANRLNTNVRLAEKILERLEVPLQSPARGINLISARQFRLAVEKGGFNRWDRREGAGE